MGQINSLLHSQWSQVRHVRLWQWREKDGKYIAQKESKHNLECGIDLCTLHSSLLSDETLP